jgi:hypothetical protein
MNNKNVFEKNEVNEDEEDSEFNWISVHSQLNQLNCKIFREPMKNIKINYVYINTEMNIKNIINESYELQNNIISNVELLFLIEKNRKIGLFKYKIMDILLYNIIIEPENIQKYIKTDNGCNVDKDMNYLMVLSLFNEIRVEPSINIFHSINSLYFIYIESKNSVLPNLVKSEYNIKKTKRVRINLNPIEIIDNKRTTKKSLL